MTAVITGASRGIGRATALLLAERGEPLALVGRPSAALDDTAAEVKQRGADVTVIPCDLSDSKAVSAATAQIVRAVGVPTAVVNNAGVVIRKPIEETTDADWAEQLDVNLRAPFQITRALLPAMRRQKRGRFVHIGSITSTIGAKHAAAYAASKWALVGFSKSLAEEIADTGLMTVVVLPGSVETRMLEGSGFHPRMTATDVARTVAYYCLDAPLAHNGGVVEMFGT